MQRLQLLISLLVGASVLALCLPLFDMVYLYPSATTLVSEKVRKDAEHLGNYLAGMPALSEDRQLGERKLQQLVEAFSLVRASLLLPSGEVLISTTPELVGTHRDLVLMRRFLINGKAFSRYVLEEITGQEGAGNLIETHSPMMHKGELVSVLELVHDVGAIRGSLEKSVSRASIFLLVVAGIFLGVIVFLASLARKAVRHQEQTAELLRESQLQLEAQHRELNKVFQQVEQAKYEWQMTLDCIEDMVLLVNGEGKIKRCNESFTRFVGLSYLGVLGENWKKILITEGVEVVTLNSQHSEIFHPQERVWLGIEFYPYQSEQDELLTVVKIQQLRKREEGIGAT